MNSASIILRICVLFCVAQPVISHNRIYESDFGAGRLCYACLLKEHPKSRYDYEYPTFDIRNLPINKAKRKALGPCAFHSKIGARCEKNTDNFKCFINVTSHGKGKKKKLLLDKGCRDISDLDIPGGDSCHPPTKDPRSNAHQTCFCSRRLCNADLVLMGGNPRLANKLYFQGDPNMSGSGRKMASQWWLILLGVALLWCVQYSDQLTCCSVDKELKITKATDNDQIVGNPCTNRGTSCKNVRCGPNTCTEDHDEPDTNCSKIIECNSTFIAPACRIVYFEKAVDLSNDDEVESTDQTLELTLENRVLQDCQDVFFQTPMGCEFFQKPFYKNKKERLTYQKECYCNHTDHCNVDIFELCIATDDDIHIINDTCYETSNHPHKKTSNGAAIGKLVQVESLILTIVFIAITLTKLIIMNFK